MITNVRIPDSAFLPIKHARGLPTLHDKSFKFKPGLNAIIAPNGFGKSALLKCIAAYFFALQGGISQVTKDGVEKLGGNFGRLVKPGLEVDHDGQPVVYFDPQQAIGLNGSFEDKDFALEAVQEMSTRSLASNGQRSRLRLLALMDRIKAMPNGTKIEVPSWAYAQVQHLKGYLDSGPITFLMDEPEQSFDLFWQTQIWNVISQMVQKREGFKHYQVIMATHDARALVMPGINIVELVPGYVDLCKRLLQGGVSLQEANRMVEERVKIENDFRKQVQDTLQGRGNWT